VPRRDGLARSIVADRGDAQPCRDGEPTMADTRRTILGWIEQDRNRFATGS